MKLICENNRSEFTRELLVEVENINHFTEQALYYARSEHTEKDYTVREIRIRDVIHDAIADSKYLLRKNHVTVEVEDDGKIAYIAGDDKPTEVVRSRLKKLNADHIRFVLDSLAENTAPVRNMKQYLLAMLYNAPTTMNLYYQNKTNHDFARGSPKAG